MSRQLYPAPQIGQLRNEARDLFRAHQQGEASCCELLRGLDRFKEQDEHAILGAELALDEAQQALATNYGSSDWAAMESHIESLRDQPDDAREGFIRIDGVPGFSARCGKQCSYVAAVEAVLRSQGEDYDYIDLMGLGGYAFSLRWVRATWDDICGGRLHPGAAASGCFGGLPEILDEATGHAYEGFGLMAAGKDKEIELLRAEFAEGRPVLGLNAHNGSLWCVITGYDPEALSKVKDEDSPPGMLCRSCYDSDDESYGRTTYFPWEIRAIRKAGDPPPREEAVCASLGRAVDLISGGPKVNHQGGGGWFWHYEWEGALGLPAYDAWAADLEDEAGIDAMPVAHFMTYWQSSAYLYDLLHDARRAALEYLRRIRPVFGSGEQTALDEAVGAMDELVDILTQGFPCVPFREDGYRHPNGWNISGRECEDFRGQQIPAHAADWPAEVRREAIALLRRAKAKEEAVLKALEKIAATL